MKPATWFRWYSLAVYWFGWVLVLLLAGSAGLRLAEGDLRGFAELGAGLLLVVVVNNHRETHHAD